MVFYFYNSGGSEIYKISSIRFVRATLTDNIMLTSSFSRNIQEFFRGPRKFLIICADYYSIKDKLSQKLHLFVQAYMFMRMVYLLFGRGQLAALLPLSH